MGQSNHKYLFFRVLVALVGGVFVFSLTSCTDNPEAEAAKTVRKQTEEALKMAEDKDLAGSQSKIANALTQNNRSKGLTKDAALMVSGNLALIQGQQMQAEMPLKALPIRGSIDAMENLLRHSESLLIEQERIEELLDQGDQEIAELQKVLDGPEGFVKQQADVAAVMNTLLSQQQDVQAKKDQTQATLDQYQAQADELNRKAELASGDQKAKLQNQAFDILQDRKDYYIDAQEAENQLNVLQRKIELEQLTLNNLTTSITETKQQIQNIENSETRRVLNQQMDDIQQTIARNQQTLASSASEITAGLNDYKEHFLGGARDQTTALGFFEEAISELGKIRSADVEFVAKLRLAEANYYAGLVCSGYANLEQSLSRRFQDLMDSTDPAFAELLAGKLPIKPEVDQELKDMIFGFYDQAIEAYDNAISRAGRIGQDAKCSVLKGKLLAVHGKMKFAEAIQDFNLADEMETALEAIKTEGAELGVCFTQSETLRVVEMGIDYVPSLPLNMDVLAEGLKVKFTAWKRKPLTEQEAEIDQNLIEIDQLISQYGQELADQLTPIKQEMLDAKERGFEATSTTTTRPSGGFDPNSL